jgi:hypothetical protein
MESITATAGCVASTVARIFSSWISASTLHLAAVNAQAARAQRHLRAAFFARDVQRGQARALQRVHGLQQQVDLPMPGSPPISTTPPSTMPPPSTRSSPLGVSASRPWSSALLARDCKARSTAPVDQSIATVLIAIND